MIPPPTTRRSHRSRFVTRCALTLIEVIVVLAIIGVLAALLVPAVMKVRRAALSLESLNNLRQLAIGTSNYAGDHRGALPRLVPPPTSERPVHYALLPYVDQAALFRFMNGEPAAGSTKIPNRSPAVFRNPLDPSMTEYGTVSGYPVSSYVCNGQVFLGKPNLRSTFSDGVSNTMLWSEQYGWNCQGSMFVYMCTWPVPRSLKGGYVGNLEGQGRPTFADFQSGDFHPITTGKTFQAGPALANCDPRMPNSSDPASLQVGFADGSVRTLSSSVSPAAFWGLITPNGGETVVIP
jgi:prepilin-type N-terminal cleavage/methylation domain-containing protein